ncbi:recombinase family protein [Streptomyces noursei]|uniref:recombinase family protein n=1 Tax=Streptomyces noursei TaxID=1971 RepID=UPI0033EBD0D9
MAPAPRTERPVRIGYARTSTARQELASQLEALQRAECHKVFQERISTRVKIRPELEEALALAHQFKEAAPETPVILTVHELKRLARNAAELMTLSAELQASGIQLELLTGPLTGIYDPNGGPGVVYWPRHVGFQWPRMVMILCSLDAFKWLRVSAWDGNT